MEKLNIAVRKAPWNASYLEGLGYVYTRTGRYDKAIDTLWQAVRNDPYYLLSYLDIAEALLLRGKQYDTGDAVMYTEDLVEKVESEGVLSREINQAAWYDHLETTPKEEPNIVWFNNARMTQSISYYWAALTIHLFLQERDREKLGDNARSIVLSQVDEGAVQGYVKKAEGLQLDEDDENTVKELLDTDIRQLQNARPSLRDALEEYRKISHVNYSE